MAVTSGAEYWKLAGLASLSLPLAMLGLPLVVTLPEYYSNALGLDLAGVGMIVMAGRIFDILLDPLLGGLMDRTRTRWGRFKPWLIIGTPLMILSTAMLFFAERGVGLAHLGVWLFLIYIGWSVLSLVQLALAAGLGKADRARSYGALQAAFFLGIALVLMLPLLLGPGYAKDAAATMTAMGWLIIGVTVPASLLVGFLIPNALSPSQTHPYSFKAIGAAIARKSVFRLVAADLLFGLGFGLASTLMIFYFTGVKHIDRSAIGLLLIGQMLTGIVATPLVARLARGLGKRETLSLCGLVAAAVCPFLLLLPEGDVGIAAVAMAAWGIPYGGVTLLPRAMMADAADEVRLSTGTDQTGMLFALLISSWKMGAALSVGLSFVALDFIGFKPALGAGNPVEALLGLKWFFAGIPACLFVIGTVFAWANPLTEAAYADIRRLLEARDRAAEQGAVPAYGRRL